MKFPVSYFIETRRCRLRAVSREDIPFIFSATRFPGFNDGMLWDPPANEEELIAPFHANVKAWEDDLSYCFSIDEQDTGTFIGRIAIRPAEGSVWDLGFWTHPEQQNRGYMTEAVAAVVRFGFEELEASKITACHAVWNLASERVLQKAGMHFVAHIPEGFQKNGKWIEEKLWAVTRGEWDAGAERKREGRRGE